VSIWPVPVRRVSSRPGHRPAIAGDYREETAMRKIVAGLFISLDGVIEDANEWTRPWFNAQVGGP
jgi:hypothetical protein